jgi:hypothetical protein
LLLMMHLWIGRWHFKMETGLWQASKRRTHKMSLSSFMLSIMNHL